MIDGEAGLSGRLEDKQSLSNAQELIRASGISISLPKKPWMPTHAGLEIRVEDPNSKPLVDQHNKKEVKEFNGDDLLQIGKSAVVAAEVAGVFAEADDTKNPDWYDKPWFNLNLNSQLGGEAMSHATWQVYLRARTLGQMRGLKSKGDYTDVTDSWSNPYWTVPVPVDSPLNPDDRFPYDEELVRKVKSDLEKHFSAGTTEKLSEVRLFTGSDGQSTIADNFEFEINKGNYPVWQLGDYLLVTQDNPLVDRKDGVHLVLIYRGEQQEDLKERYNYLWRDPGRIAEMGIIAAAASKLITTYGYAGGEFDKSYIHLNANWSLDYAIPAEERHEIMDKGSMGHGVPGYGGRWPGPRQEQTVPGPNAHPHIQVLRIDDENGHHELDIGFSPGIHKKTPKVRQTDEEIEGLKDLLKEKLTPLIHSLQGQRLFS